MNVPDEVMAELEANLLPRRESILRRGYDNCCADFLMTDSGCTDDCRVSWTRDKEWIAHLVGEEPLSPASAREGGAISFIGCCPGCGHPWTRKVSGAGEAAHARRAAIIDNIRIALGDIDEATEQSERARLMPV